MELNIHDVYICLDDDWDSISTYSLEDKTDKEIILNSPAHSFRNQQVRIIAADKQHKLQIYPFSLHTRQKYEKLAQIMLRVGDLVCAFLSTKNSITLDNLTKQLLQNKEKYKIDEFSIDWILRCLTAGKIIVPTNKKDTISFSLGPSHRARENARKFSATIAGELDSLSKNVSFIINHAPSLGTYRENLLQSTLRRYLPERYHVATGFIFGLNKQIDILIYDRIDYAPIFREGDLVIVPQESVRAIIEVKTTLTSHSLKSALKLLNQVSEFDDTQPPFFKGIYAFESRLKPDKLYKEVASFYTDWNAQAQGAEGVLICRPFQHLTCVCVNNNAFAYTEYSRNANSRFVPMLYSKSSATQLNSQSAFFIQSLLSYLKFGGMKPSKIDYVGWMLGEDSCIDKIKDLREGDDSWGSYFSFDEGDDEEDAVKEMERLIQSAQNWINGQNNFEIVPPQKKINF